MKKSGFMLVIVALSMLLVSACDNKDKGLSIGVIKDGTYQNDYFGISLHFPKEWESYSAGAMMTQDSTTEMVPITQLESQTADSSANLANADLLDLLTASKYPLNGKESGPSINVSALKLGSIGDIKTSKEYVELLQEQLESPYVLKEVTTAQISGKTMDVVQVAITNNGVTRSQDAYITIVNDYILGVVVTYVDEESKTETDQILQSISLE